MVIYHYVIRTSKNEHSGALTTPKEIETPEEYAKAREFIEKKLGLEGKAFAITKMKVLHSGSSKEIRKKMKQIEKLIKKQKKGV